MNIVEPSSGRICWLEEDFTLPSAFPLRFERRYSNLGIETGVLGIGWRHGYGHEMRIVDGRWIHVDDEGQALPVVTPAPGLRRTDGPLLIRPGDRPIIRLTNGRTIEFQLVDGDRALPIREDGVESPAIFYGYQGDRLISVVSASGSGMLLDYDLHGMLSQIQDVERQRTLARFSYSGPYLTSASDIQGASRRYSYVGGLLSEAVNRTGGSTFFAYDDQGRCVETRRGDGSHHWRYEFIGDGGLVRVIAPTGEISALFFDEHKRLIRTERPDGSARFRTFGPHSEPLEVIDLEPDDLGHFETSGSGAESPGSDAQERDEFGNITREIDADGSWEGFSHDFYSRLTEYSASSGWRTRFAYDEVGRLLEQDTPLGNRIHADRSGGTLTVTDTIGLVLQSSGDLTNHSIRWSSGRQLKGTYGDHGNFVVIERSNARATRDYDQEGYLTRSVDFAGLACRYDRDQFGRLIRWADSQGRSIVYRRDPLDRLIEARTEQGRTCRFVYDSRGRVVERQFPSGAKETFERSARGALVVATIGKLRTEYRYDPEGLLLSLTSGSAQFRFDYDAAGNCTTAASGETVVERKYGPNSLLLAESSGEAAISYDWNEAELITRRRAGQRNTAYSYDVRGHVTSIDDDVFGKVVFSFDEHGRKTSCALPNGVVRRFEYDIEDQVKGVSVELAGITSTGRRYAYSESGEIVRMSEGASTVEFTYDSALRLLRRQTSEGKVESFRLDPGDNFIEFRNQPVALEGDLVRSFRGDSFEYDEAGRLIEIRGPRSARLHYLSRGLLSGISSDVGEFVFSYDAFGRRVRAQYKPASGEGWDRQFVWDRDTVLWEVWNGPREKRRIDYLFEPDSFRPLGHAVNGRCYFYNLDQQGMVREVYGPDGSLAASFQYTSFGEIESADVRDELASHPFRLLGQWADPDCPFVYNRFRYFDPSLGRFISPDPYLDDVRANPYSWAPNPISWSDPSGLMPAFSPADNELWIEENKAANGGFYSCSNCGFKHKQRVFARAESGRPVGDGAFHGDHIVPNADGGAAQRDNHQVLGGTCNCSKGRGRPIGMT